MGKSIFIILLVFITPNIFSQSSTEVFILDISKKGNNFELKNQRNISNNEGYDNQPSFLNNDILLFSSTRNKQTDIKTYNDKTSEINWITNTKEGSEYSPIKIPNQNAISSIRLDTNGTQLLYRYDYKTGIPKILLKDLKVGYHCWYSEHTLASAVLEDNGLSLVISDLKNTTNKTLQKNIGRALHKIPDTKLLSYISKENKQWEIKSIDPITGKTSTIINTIAQSEDICWLPDGTILMAKGNTIFKYNSKTDKNWSILHAFLDKEINTITRISTNQKGDRIAIVSDISPEHIVQKQLDAYNARDIDAFLATYSNTIKVFSYPNELNYEGKETMKKSYASFFDSTPDLHCEIKNRIVIGNKVIDEEFLTINGKNYAAAAIYEVKNGKIVKVTFIQ
ncbi:nuclear transport factor 2 family protein [Aquimarina aggregata]|uniref:nuclear transport factor 2 family protein n=1 Tax=Aquimarina aggregata TaxID=1642818 RepID=UPI0024909892|nr:nuclear transport factor 2 family protein [Aquimarina aggregata]